MSSYLSFYIFPIFNKSFKNLILLNRNKDSTTHNRTTKLEKNVFGMYFTNKSKTGNNKIV